MKKVQTETEVQIQEPETVDDLVNVMEGQLRDETGISTGVKTLMTIEPSQGQKNTDIEIKTILEHNQIIDHTVVEFIGDIIQMKPKELEERPVIIGLTEKLERKFLSLKGKSRDQVVEMVKNNMEMPAQKRGGLGRFFGGNG